MNVTIYSHNNPSQSSASIAKNLARNLESIDGILSDNDCKSIIKKTLKQKQKLNYRCTDLRIDAFKDGIGVVSAMGTTANISRRVLSSIHYHKSNMISEIIFVCQSPVNAWYQHNHTKTKPQSSNGNRATSKVLTSLIEHLGNTIEFPVIVIELDDQKATSEFHRTMVKSEIYLTNDFKIDWNILE